MGATKIYIAGPMTGLLENNLPAFAAAARQLDALGHDAVNPGRHGVTAGYTWQDYMRRGLTELVGCEALALLPGWSRSEGATLEVQVARALVMPVRPLHEWLEVAA